MNALDVILCVIGLLAGLAVAGGCAMVLIVWIGGGGADESATEAWRRPDGA